jgi:hypothetical protein
MFLGPKGVFFCPASSHPTKQSHNHRIGRVKTAAVALASCPTLRPSIYAFLLF